jgi:uncharacterized membrane protein YedE/YeeE
MFIDWSQFTPWSALIGGGIIGLAAALLILLTGRIAGISGIVWGLFTAGRAMWDGVSLLFPGLLLHPWSGSFSRSCR